MIPVGAVHERATEAFHATPDSPVGAAGGSAGHAT